MTKKVLQIEAREKGMALSGGCVIGNVCMFNEGRHRKLPKYKVDKENIDKEIARVEMGIKQASQELLKIKAEVEEKIGVAEAEIFVAHRMILEDPTLIKEIRTFIREEAINAEEAIAHVLNEYESRLQALDDEYIKARATDFGEIKRRLLDILGDMQPTLQCDTNHCKIRERIIVANELTPSLTINIDTDITVGFITEHGGVNSHAAILARALGIPAVSGVANIRNKLSCGTEILMDGDTGEIVIWPEDKTVSKARAKGLKSAEVIEPVDPVEGFKVMANINLASDIKEALKMKAEGIGLYRTEFEMLAAGRFFSEDELYKRYISVGEAMAGKGVIFRLFDIGSDKALPFMNVPYEENPSLGWRGARLLLGNKELLTTQARALARTSEGGRIHVMYPMIIDLEQFLEIKKQFIEAISDIAYGEILHGIMFEVPSACLQAEELFQHIDFASVGTNDLTQYLFAVDRNNDLVSYDYNPDRKVFWDLLRNIADAASATGKPLSVCGELAGYPQYVSKLKEMGINRVSVSSRRISSLRNTIRETA